MAIKAVIFDFGGVIMNYTGLAQMWKDMAQENGFDMQLMNEIMMNNGLHNYMKSVELDLFKGEVSAHEIEQLHFPDMVRKHHSLEMATHIPVLSMWIGNKSNVNYSHRVLSVISQLRARGYKTALLTNNFHIDREGKLQRTPIDFSLFDVVVESAVEGTRKPEKRIYEICTERLSAHGVTPEECVFLDDLQENLDEAEKIGWKTILVNGRDPDTCIPHLEQSLGIRFGDENFNKIAVNYTEENETTTFVEVKTIDNCTEEEK